MVKKRANGEGNIRKRADGRWEGRYTAGYHPETGKRIIKNVLGKTQAECKAKLKKAIEESQSLDIGRADEYTVAAWLRTWFELYSKLHIRPSTMNYYHRNIEQHIIPAIGDIPLNKLTTRDLQKFYNDLQSNGRLRKVQKKEKPGLSNSTVRGIHSPLLASLQAPVVYHRQGRAGIPPPAVRAAHRRSERVRRCSRCRRPATGRSVKRSEI